MTEETPPVDPTPPVETPPVNQFATPTENWRQDLVSAAGFEGDDSGKRLAQLERITDLPAMTKSYFAAQDKIRSGETSTGLPDDPTPEQLTAYREANGVPEEASGYELTLDEGLVLGESDKSIMDAVFEHAHAANVPTSVVSSMTNALLRGQDDALHAMVEKDGLQAQQTQDTLRTHWGPEYQVNMNIVESFLNMMPEETRENLAGARMGDGTALLNDPGWIQYMATAQRQINPFGAVVPGSANALQASSDRKAELVKMMGEPGWHKNQSAQDEYMRITDAEEQYKKNNASS